MDSKNSNPKFTGERHIFHYTFLFDAYLTRRFAFVPYRTNGLIAFAVCCFGVMEGKEFTLSNPLFTLSALDYFPFFTI